MADDDKTEEPTPKKIEDAKKEGNVSKSMEVTGAAILTFGSMYILFFSSFSLLEIKKMMLYSFGFIGEPLDSSVLYSLTISTVLTLLKSLSPIFILVILLALVSNWMQFGMIAVPLKIDLKKLDALKGLKNLFSMKKLLEALKLSAKLVIIMVVMVILFLLLGDSLIAMMNQSTPKIIESMVTLTGYFLATILLIIIIFAIMDFYFSRHYYMKSLKMSKQEIKDEFKNMEGDPQVKGRIRRIQMQMAQKRMMQDVPQADVIITNPTHYAVALKYDNKIDAAPKVLAKGINFIALRIKEIARENKIPIVESPSLARSLYDQIEVEDEVPKAFYKAVAEIFSYVYELKKKQRR